MSSIIQSDIESIVGSNLPWVKLKNKTVFITGGTGFIGNYMVRTLDEANQKLDLNLKLLLLVRPENNQEDPYQDLNKTEIGYINSDLCDLEKIDEEVHFVIHAASNAEPRLYNADPTGTIKTNVVGTNQLFEALEGQNIEKLLYLSTVEVYGKAEFEDTIKEDDFGYMSSMNPRSCYPLSKKMSENICVSYAYQYGYDISIGRLAYIYGAGMNINNSLVVADFARKLVNEEDIIMKSMGAQNRSYTYIADAVVGIFTILLNGEKSTAYNIASDSTITIRGLADKMLELQGVEGQKLVIDIPEEEKELTTFIEDAILSNEKLKSIGFKDTVNIDEGLNRMLDYFRAEIQK